MNTNPKIFVVILNFNGASSLPACLASVFQSDYPNFEVVIVDNDSKDGSFEKARTQYSRAHFIKNSSNVGFAKGNNVGIRYALEKFADFVFVLNNDTEIEKNVLSDLIQTFDQNSAAGIISPLILTEDKKNIWFAGGKIDWLKMRTEHIQTRKSTSPYSSEYISGCAMMIKKEVFKKVGLFDERFFLYYEDADFSIRTKKGNFKLLIEPSVQIMHQEQSTSNNPLKVYWLVLSGLIFFKTHAYRLQKIWLYIYIPLRRLKNLCNLSFSPTDTAQDIRKAYIDYKNNF